MLEKRPSAKEFIDARASTDIRDIPAHLRIAFDLATLSTYLKKMSNGKVKTKYQMFITWLNLDMAVR